MTSIVTCGSFFRPFFHHPVPRLQIPNLNVLSKSSSFGVSSSGVGDAFVHRRHGSTWQFRSTRDYDQVLSPCRAAVTGPGPRARASLSQCTGFRSSESASEARGQGRRRRGAVATGLDVTRKSGRGCQHAGAAPDGTVTVTSRLPLSGRLSRRCRRTVTVTAESGSLKPGREPIRAQAEKLSLIRPPSGFPSLNKKFKVTVARLGRLWPPFNGLVTPG